MNSFNSISIGKMIFMSVEGMRIGTVQYIVVYPFGVSPSKPNIKVGFVCRDADRHLVFMWGV